MTNLYKSAGFVIAGIIVGLLFSAFGGSTLGGVYNQVNTTFREGIKVGTSDQFQISSAGAVTTSGAFTVGSNGTSLAAIKTGSCTIWAPATTIAASTTQQIVCQSATDGSLTSGLTGVTADSICQLTMASSTNTTSNSLVIAGVSASSTPGSIVARLSNFVGTTFTWSAVASSSTKWNYMCFDPS